MNQKGFTLIEILVAMAVGGMIMTGIVTGIFQILHGTGQIRVESVALADIESAAHWLSRDIPMGEGTDLVDGGPTESDMTIIWNDYTWWAQQEESVAHSVAYTYSGTELQRSYDDGVVTTVGRHLTEVGFSLNGNLVTVTLTSSPDMFPRSTVTRSYKIRMRGE